jgi:ferrous iron transport protein B
VGFLASKVIKGETSDFIIEIPPFRIPKISNIIVKTLYRVEWFLKEAVPLFLLGTAILFLFDKLGILSLLERISEPVVKTLLNLPPQTTEAFILGFLRRDYGAAGLFKLARLGQLDPLQILVSMIVITLFVPCIANFLVIIKERGLKTALLIVGFIFPYAFLVGGLINHLLRFLGVRL